MTCGQVAVIEVPVGAVDGWSYASRYLQAVPRGKLNLTTLVELHMLLLPRSYPHWGELRDSPGMIRLGGIVHRQLPEPSVARTMAEQTLLGLDTELSRGAPIDAIPLASEICFELVDAHPFVDGNGRVARAVATWLLERTGYRPIRDLRSYCRERNAAQYQALAIRQGMSPYAADPMPWLAFFTSMVENCFRPPTALRLLDSEPTFRTKAGLG